MDREGSLGFEMLFQITRVSDEIMYHLGSDMEAMKSLSAASKTTLQVVRANPTFLNRAMRGMTSELLAGSAAINNATGLSGLLATEWKALKMNIQLIRTHHNELEQAGTLELAKSIKLYGLPNFRHCSREDSTNSGYMERILELTRDLRELILEDRLLLQIQDEFWQNDKVMKALLRIEAIQIFTRDSRVHPTGNPPVQQEQIALEWGGERPQSSFWNNFQRLSVTPAQLRKCRLETARIHWHNFKFQWLQFLSKHVGTLEEVELHLGILRFADRGPDEVGSELERCCTGCGVFADYYTGWAILRPNRLEHFGLAGRVGPPQIDRDRELREVIREIQCMGVMGAGGAGVIEVVFQLR